MGIWKSFNQVSERDDNQEAADLQIMMLGDCESK